MFGSARARWDALTAVTWVILAAGVSSAGVQDMRTLVAADGSLIHHYTFEGDAVARLEDKSGSAHLEELAAGAGSTASIVYFTGYDATTTAVTPHRINNTAGAALRTENTIGVPDTLTVEMLFRPDSIGAGGRGYAVNVGSGPSDQRGYFLLQENDQVILGLQTVIGDDFWEADNRYDIVPHPYPLEQSVGHWYYYAETLSQSGGNTSITAYVADFRQHHLAERLGPAATERQCHLLPPREFRRFEPLDSRILLGIIPDKRRGRWLTRRLGETPRNARSSLRSCAR